ncbi:MAG: glycosyltransferase [bacterium]
MYTIVVTGGHHNSALVVAKLLLKKGHQVVWIGHRKSSRGDQFDSAEYLELSAAGIPFHNLTAARLLPDAREFTRFPLGVIKALKILQASRPTAILSFGGYLGGTIALAGKLLGIPIYLHEQTVIAGKANKLIGRLAKRIYLTWPESTKYFVKSKTKVVGLPLRESILTAKPKKLFSRHKPTLLILGGKQGAHAINQFIFAHLTDLLMEFNLVHQTGTNSCTRDYDHALALQNSLGSLADSYLPIGYITENDIGSYLQSANYYLGRSGAHITYELGILGLPSIFVPLLSTHDHEQHKNAAILVRAKCGLILAQSELSLPHFAATFASLRKLRPHPLSLPQKAGDALVTDLLSTLT